LLLHLLVFLALCLVELITPEAEGQEGIDI
jgi:hypothetical protein